MDTEIEIVKSVTVAEKALKKVDVTHHYYTTRNYKEVELYDEAPFQVGMLKGYDVIFELVPVDNARYRLIVEKTEDENKTEWSYEKTHRYGEEVVTPHFHLNVIRTNAKMEDGVYHFNILDPIKAGRLLQEQISVSQTSKKASVLQISYEDNIPLRAQKFTDALARAYIERSVERKTREAELELAFIDKQLTRITKNLKDSAMKLEKFKRSSNTVDLSAKAQKILEQMTLFETQLTEITMREKQLDKLYKKIKTGENIESISIDAMQQTMQQSSLSLMIKKLQDAIVSRNILRQDYTKVHPLVRRSENKIAELKKIIIRTIRNLSQSISEKKTLLEKSIAKQQKLLNTLPADERVYGELQRKFSINEKVYSYLLQKQSEAAILKASTVSKSVVLDKAFLPEKPIKPKKKLIVIVAFITGLILGIFLAFFRAFMDDRIKNEEDVAHRTRVPVFGKIPHIKENANKVSVLLSPKSVVAESFRHLRTNLQFMQKSDASHIIALTSTVGGEGKTTVALNLAAIMSMTGRRTVLLHLDMRKPTLHEKFGISNAQGMSTYLSGHATLEEVIQSTGYENLDAITSGPIPPNPSELIETALMKEAIERLSSLYDVVILDTPPIGLVTDARNLMHYADTNLYVMRADYSKKSFLKNIEELAALDDIRGFGIVLNALKSGNGSYGYGYGYYEEDKK
jgi:capsular exopolysaccharide synthesis family protein